MSSEGTNKLKQILEEIESSCAALRKINNTLREYHGRLELIYQQYRRKMPVKDTSFQEEFRSTMLELKTFTENSNSFWQQIRTFMRSADKNKLIDESRISVKQLKINAQAFNRQTDELYTIFKNIQQLAGEVPLRLNWWMLESSCDELGKTTSRILFLIRDMEKYL